ncbi:BTB/POZ domain-containing protein 19-like [Ptychodera flava]|uniref:BTB/POZ domain-containing protein 19-like n=1 Tax=Ptychodera flava TaxID=63121 RepID=UPI00396A072E
MTEQLKSLNSFTHVTFPTYERTDQQSEVAGRLDRHSECLMALFNQPEISDVKLVVGKLHFNVSKFPLAAYSSVFRTMLCDPSWHDSSKSEIILDESPECIPEFENFLKFMYSGKISLSLHGALPVLALADKYNVTPLKSICEDFMIDVVGLRRNIEGAMLWLHSAGMYGLHALADLCFNVITTNLHLAVDTSQWIQLDTESLYKILKSTDTVIYDEYILFWAVEKWVSSRHDYDSEPAANAYLLFLQQMMPCIHFTEMSPRQILEIENSQFGKTFKLQIQDYITAGYRHHALQQDGEETNHDQAQPTSRFPRIYLSRMQKNQLSLRWDFIPLHDTGACHTNFVLNVNIREGKGVLRSDTWNLGMNFTESAHDSTIQGNSETESRYENQANPVKDLMLRFYPNRSHANSNYHIILVLMEVTTSTVYQARQLQGEVPDIEIRKPHQRATFQFFQTPISCTLTNLLKCENLHLFIEVFLAESQSELEQRKYQLGPLQC